VYEGPYGEEIYSMSTMRFLQ